MIAKQARALREGDRVRDDTNGWDGEVKTAAPNYIMIEWEIGNPHPRSHLHPADCAELTLQRCERCMRQYSRCACEPEYNGPNAPETGRTSEG